MVFYSQIEEKWGKLLKMEKIEFLIIFDGSARLSEPISPSSPSLNATVSRLFPSSIIS